MTGPETLATIVDAVIARLGEAGSGEFLRFLTDRELAALSGVSATSVRRAFAAGPNTERWHLAYALAAGDDAASKDIVRQLRREYDNYGSHYDEVYLAMLEVTGRRMADGVGLAQRQQMVLMVIDAAATAGRLGRDPVWRTRWARWSGRGCLKPRRPYRTRNRTGQLVPSARSGSARRTVAGRDTFKHLCRVSDDMSLRYAHGSTRRTEIHMHETETNWSLCEAFEYDLQHAPASYVALGHPASQPSTRSASSTRSSMSAQAPQSATTCTPAVSSSTL